MEKLILNKIKPNIASHLTHMTWQNQSTGTLLHTDKPNTKHTQWLSPQTPSSQIHSCGYWYKQGFWYSTRSCTSRVLFTLGSYKMQYLPTILSNFMHELSDPNPQHNTAASCTKTTPKLVHETELHCKGGIVVDVRQSACHLWNHSKQKSNHKTFSNLLKWTAQQNPTKLPLYWVSFMKLVWSLCHTL